MSQDSQGRRIVHIELNKLEWWRERIIRGHEGYVCKLCGHVGLIFPDKGMPKQCPACSKQRENKWGA